MGKESDVRGDDRAAKPTPPRPRKGWGGAQREAQGKERSNSNASLVRGQNVEKRGKRSCCGLALVRSLWAGSLCLSAHFVPKSHGGQESIESTFKLLAPCEHEDVLRPNRNNSPERISPPPTQVHQGGGA